MAFFQLENGEKSTTTSSLFLFDVQRQLQIEFAKMPEFFMPALAAPIPATAGSAGTKKRFFFRF
jgi:hypothetical protein